jgi:hypothetical protein
MKAITSWLVGKKTYLAAAVLVLLGIVAWWNGAGNELSLAVIVFGLGLAGLGAKSERYGRATLAGMDELKKSLADKKLTRLEMVAIIERVLAESGALDHLPESKSQAMVLATRVAEEISEVAR